MTLNHLEWRNVHVVCVISPNLMALGAIKWLKTHRLESDVYRVELFRLTLRFFDDLSTAS